MDSYALVAERFRCDDGSNPFDGDLKKGAQSRVGNVGENSTGHIIDKYRVPCPEKVYMVFVDMYMCNRRGQDL